jgi:hypothetical protein
MRKLFSILFALILLLAGMHFTVATHFCGGEIAAKRVSFAGHLASCGMKSDGITSTTSQTNITAHCCDNEISTYTVDNNYTPAEFHGKEITQKILHEFNIPAAVSFEHKYHSSLNLTNASPPCDFSANAVSMADICVFRI